MRKPVPFGPWLLLDRIAMGGMAEVFLALRAGERPPRPFALKRMLAPLSDDVELVTMFLDEARVWAQLAHPSILPVRELGREDGVYYIAYDYLPGKDLRAVEERLRARRALFPVGLAAHVALRVADALDHAHRRRGAGGEALRVVHNDVSPANVLLGFDGSVRVIDFGIAQAAIRVAPSRSTRLRGKFAYLSPEAVRGLPVDRRADVYSLGVVLHEMLTGERLFGARSELATLVEVRSARVRPPSVRREEVPAGLDAAVLRALAPRPEDRFRWASDLRDALSPYAELDGGPALARLLAEMFPSELSAELSRLGRL
ncbi:MAG TPA: serine/threonine-protein kinase [Anaeromyxobacter sp.]|nr:serine/threonine-protein kinase [Anaeromyxobacter sp.]